MTPLATAGAGFLLAVLWFDLMHDVQVIGDLARGRVPAARSRESGRARGGSRMPTMATRASPRSSRSAST